MTHSVYYDTHSVYYIERTLSPTKSTLSLLQNKEREREREREPVVQELTVSRTHSITSFTRLGSLGQADSLYSRETSTQWNTEHHQNKLL